ncbi:MAG: FKBP-type peptidyl-prolyl cis-trans isomerase [Paludibacteraceae bacterium]
MKKTILVLLAVLVAANFTYAKKKEKKQTLPIAPETVLTNNVDSMSYALGVNMGNDFVKNLKGIPGGKSNIDLIIKGFSTAMKGDSTILSQEVAQTYFRDYIAKAQSVDNEQKKSAGERFLAENKTKQGISITPSGLQYEVLKPAEGPKPKATDKVKVHYTGTTIDGHVFDSSVQRGEPVEFTLNQVIPGWSEGVQLMNVGSKYKFYIPYNLAYGEQGISQAGIPPFAPLIFEVELLDIVKQEPAPVVEEVKPAATKSETTKKPTAKVSNIKKK